MTRKIWDKTFGQLSKLDAHCSRRGEKQEEEKQGDPGRNKKTDTDTDPALARDRLSPEWLNDETPAIYGKQ